MNIRFDGRAVAVTGAGHGFGRAIARGFAQAGARVFATDVAAEGLGETAAGTTMRTDALDLDDRAAAASWIAAIEAAAGPLHVLVHNAGGVRGQVGRPVETVDDGDWDAIFRVNLDAAFVLARAAVPGMKRAGRGRIVTISSGAGLGPSKTGIQAYAAAKHALIGLTRQLAHELGRFGITANSVAPGFVLSNPATERQFAALGPEGQRALIDGIAMKRLGSPEDIAHAVLFLASDQAGWINGQVLSVDGGR